MKRTQTKKIYVGDVPVGGGSPIPIQSMTNTETKDVEATVRQILELERAGCDISRSAITDLEDARAITLIKKRTSIPFIADIQFDWRLAVAAVEGGCDCLRINPGNIGDESKLAKIVRVCRSHGTPIRVGVNSGSLHQTMIDRYGGVNADSIVHSALEEVKVLENLDFDDIKISIKSSNVNTSLVAYEKLSELCSYPLHVGITEAGPGLGGTVKSAVGIGAILAKGIGDTIRVSLTGDPVEEVLIGKEILRSLGLRADGIEIISCPTCARTKIDLIGLVRQAQRALNEMDKKMTVAIMGCPVNGPGEAKEADIGIAGGKGQGLIFKKGKIVKQVEESKLLEELLAEIRSM
jgi:(E)-4-hydroxy-3-methylbut-2-enyl-diphosphate synthase